MFYTASSGGWQHALTFPPLTQKALCCRALLVTKKKWEKKPPWREGRQCLMEDKKPAQSKLWQKAPGLFQAGQKTWQCRLPERENSRFPWLTNQFVSQTRPEAEQQVCFRGGGGGEASVGIWVLQCFNSTTVIAGCLRTAHSTNTKRSISHYSSPHPINVSCCFEIHFPPPPPKPAN